jgi:hypothetical protein
LFTDLLSAHPPTPKEIAEKISEVLRRNEEARIYHWFKQAKRIPPRRGTANGQAGAPKKKRRR